MKMFYLWIKRKTYSFSACKSGGLENEPESSEAGTPRRHIFSLARALCTSDFWGLLCSLLPEVIIAWTHGNYPR